MPGKSPRQVTKTPTQNYCRELANCMSHACKNSTKMLAKIKCDQGERVIETEGGLSTGKPLICKRYKEGRSYVISLN